MERDDIPKVLRDALEAVAAAEKRPIARSRIVVDVENREVDWNDWPIEGLEEQHFKLLAHLWENKDRVCSFEELEKAHGLSREALMAQVKKLRRKMEPNPSNPVHFVIEEDSGIRLVDEVIFD